MQVYAPHLTAIVRTSPSAPTRRLHGLGLLRGRCLDYGCGRGKDADAYGMAKYDPYWSPAKPAGTFDTVTCTYVLNVVRPEDVPYILKDIRTLLAPGGTAYLAVRRDLGGRTRKGRGTLQRHVVLDLPEVARGRGYCVYVLKGIDKRV